MSDNIKNNERLTNKSTPPNLRKPQRRAYWLSVLDAARRGLLELESDALASRRLIRARALCAQFIVGAPSILARRLSGK